MRLQGNKTVTRVTFKICSRIPEMLALLISSRCKIYSHMRLLEEYWDAFHERDCGLQAWRKDPTYKDHEYVATDVTTVTEAAYIEAGTWLQQKLAGFSLPEQKSTTDQSATVPAQALAPTPLHPLPYYEKPKLPHFSGKLRDWKVFKERFTSAVIDEPGYKPRIKLQLLFNCVEGDAAYKLRGIKLRENNFDVAWKRLCKKYDNELKKLWSLIQRLTNLPAADSEKSEHTNLLLNVVEDALTTFTNIKRPVGSYDDFLICFVATKLAATHQTGLN